jgi:hypothetical protein
MYQKQVTLTPSWKLTILTRGLTSILALMMCICGSGCDDESLPVRERQILVEVPGGDPAAYDDGTWPDANRAARILVPAGDLEKTVPLGGEVEIGAIVFDQNGLPVMGERVRFNIRDATPDGAALTAAATTTDLNGFARVNFYAGQEIRGYEVEVKHDQAVAPVIFSVEVLNLPTGSLSVRFDYQGPVSLDQLEIYLVDQPTVCDSVYYLAPPDGVVLSQNGLQVTDQFISNALPAGDRYGIVVRARSAERGSLAAGGCVGDVRIIEGEFREVTVSLLLLPLNPGGTFEVINHFDFTDAIPGQVGDVIDGLVRFFGDQNNEREIGGIIFDTMERLAREIAGTIGGIVIELISTWIEDDLNALINRYIDDDAPQWIRDFFTIGSDLISVVSNMEVISEITFTKSRSDGTFEGAQNWIGLAFYWRLGCEENAPDDCGRVAFTMDEIVEGANGVQLVFGQFDGRVHSHNLGIINLHNMDLQYGRLVLFVLNQVILPRFASGATSLDEALINLANCPEFANRMTGGRSQLRLGGINVVSRARIESWCVSAMSLVGGGATLILQGLEIDTRMDLQGEMMFIEETDDLIVDRIIDGVWRGAIRTADEAAPPFEGDFSGEREENEMMSGG